MRTLFWLAFLLLQKFDCTCGGTGGEKGSYGDFDGYGNGKGKSEKSNKSCKKQKNTYMDVPCDVFEEPTPGPEPSSTPPTAEPPQEPSPEDSSGREPGDGPTLSPSPAISESEIVTSPPSTVPPEPGLPAPPAVAPSPADWVDDAVCRTDGGSFGTIGTNGLTSIAEFTYEVESAGASGAADLETEILPALEVSFNDYLLSSLFPGLCSRRRRQYQRRLAVLGISSDPPDEIDPTKACLAAAAPGNVCSVVEGYITLYSDSGLFLVNQELARSSLQEGMESDAFLHSHPDLVRVSYISPEEEVVDGENDIIDDEVDSVEREIDPLESSDKDRNTVLIGTVVSAGAIFLLAGYFIFRRRGRTTEEVSLVGTDERETGEYPVNASVD